ncbi:MAG: fibronectin type III domain-containing protein [Elusimicrobia bacterium]|nr:fibronectin type III domain-containing protein [Elusimicrobiota bacterium]
MKKIPSLLGAMFVGALSWAAADLEMVSFAAVPGYGAAKPGESIPVNAQIRNNGDVSVPSTVILFNYSNGTSTSTAVGPVAPGQTRVISLLPLPGVAAEGDHTIAATVDGINAIAEGNESNNTLSAPFTVDGTPPALAFTSPLNNHVSTGAVAFDIAANDNTGIVRVDLQINGGPSMTFTTPPFQYVWNTAGVTAGNHSAVAMAFDKAWNITTSVVNVYVPPAGSAPDLVISTVSLSPAAVLAGQSVPLAIQFTVTNQGNLPISAPFHVRSANTVAGQVRISSVSVPAPLAAGASYTGMLYSLTPSVSGLNTVSVFADQGNLIAEGDETNNTRRAYLAVDGSGPTVLVSTDALVSPVSGIVAFPVQSADGESGLDRVQFLVDGVVVNTVPAAVYPIPGAEFPYYVVDTTFTWDSRTVQNGAHALGARGIDRLGLTTDVTLPITVSNPDQSQLISVSPAVGATVLARKTFSTVVTVKNTGTTAWTRSGGYQLSAVNGTPALWGPTGVLLGVSETIVPAVNKAFSLSLVAPSTPGVYALQYQMTHNGPSFGQPGLNQTVTVLADTVPPTVPGSPALSAASTTTLTLSWGAASDNVRVASYVVDVSTNPTFAPAWPGYNGLNVGNVTSRVLTGLATGTTYHARVNAVDANALVGAKSATASRATLATVDVTPPAVLLSTPTGGQVLTSNLTASATASDDNQVKSVVFAMDGAVKLTDTAAPYQYAIPVSTLVNGSHTLTATATDYANNASSHTIVFVASYDRTPPGDPASVFIKYPTVSGFTVTWSAATDNVGVAGHRLDLSLTPTFATYVSGYQNLNVGNVLSRAITGLAAGTTYHARVRAYDANGNVSVNNITGVGATLATPDTVNPVVAISTPFAGSTVSGVVPVSAIASDANGVTQVRFNVDGSWKFTDTEAPYAFVWDTSLLATGNHSLQAVAHDPSGRTGTHTVTVNVSRPGMAAAAVAEHEPETLFGLKEALVFPSPVRGSAGTVRVVTGSADRVRAEVDSLRGERVWEMTWEGGSNAGGVYEAAIPTSGLTTGVYVLRVESQKGGEIQKTTRKFAVVR